MTPEERLEKACDVYSSAEELTELARHPDLMLRLCVSRNSGAPPSALEELALDEDQGVRRGVAGHPLTPAETLAALSRDADVEVRWTVAAHERTPLEALALLAEDSRSSVRGTVARNPSCPLDLLRLLARDPEHLVVRVAVREWAWRALCASGSSDLYAALGEDPRRWSEDRQRQLLRELGEDA